MRSEHNKQLNRPFHNFKASRSGDRRTLFSSEMSHDGIKSSKILKRLVGIFFRFCSYALESIDKLQRCITRFHFVGIPHGFKKTSNPMCPHALLKYIPAIDGSKLTMINYLSLFSANFNCFTFSSCFSEWFTSFQQI